MGYAPLTEPGLRHLDMKAAVRETTDTGEFTALAAGWNTDRTGKRIIRGAFRDTIEAWKASGKDVPLAWDHGRDARDIIGSIDPASMEERDDGLFVAGHLDLEDSELAREAWRSLKRNRISLSFGFAGKSRRSRLVSEVSHRLRLARLRRYDHRGAQGLQLVGYQQRR